ncbi:uncharacterized protein [Haliotis cracherodii]|uniref:uncharacterized protein n=1 Tax=Haliotis cracherodii TaxID=6455 RepID=UPI0039EC654C
MATHNKVMLMILLTVLSVPSSGAITKCEKMSSCSCKTDKGVVDLTPLSSTNGPRFKDMPAPNGDKFSWNPCKSFSEGTCKGVAACQIQKLLPPSYFNIGNQDSATFTVDQGLKLTYSAATFLDQPGAPNTVRTTKVSLVCDESKDPGELTVDGETKAGSAVYVMTLASKYACESVPATPSGISVGTVLDIILLVCTVLYVCVGIGFQKYVRKAEGREILPHYSFWVDLPRLIRDGTLFAVSLCGRRSTSKTYDNI